MTMFIEILLAVVMLPLLLLGWVVVQHAWRRQFRQGDRDGDVLAFRSSCGNCGCTTSCERDEDPQEVQTRRTRS